MLILIAIIAFPTLIIISYYNHRKSKGEIHNHWNTLIPSFEYSTKEFYKQLEELIKRTEVKGIKTKVVTEKEGNEFSASRLYLSVKWKEYHYYMCAAPFGEGLFISSWLYHKMRKREELISVIPILGPALLKKFYPITMYRVDTASMYMTYCHNALTQVIDEITKETGFRLREKDRYLSEAS